MPCFWSSILFIFTAMKITELQEKSLALEREYPWFQLLKLAAVFFLEIRAIICHCSCVQLLISNWIAKSPWIFAASRYLITFVGWLMDCRSSTVCTSKLGWNGFFSVISRRSRWTMRSSVPPGTPPVPMYRYCIKRKKILLFCTYIILRYGTWWENRERLWFKYLHLPTCPDFFFEEVP